MTRKKSNVKALALAVTCAILAGGYSGLNPVYAETPVYHDVVKYDSANRTLDYEFDAGAGTGTAAIQKINFGNIVLDGSSGAGVITATGLKLNGIGDVKTAIEGKADQAAVTDNKNNIQTLETKTKNISYNATTGTTVEGVVLKDKGISAAGGKFTVKADGQTVFTGAPDDKDKTTIKNGETVVEGANGKVTINNSGIDIAQTAQDTGESYSIKLDSGYVKASGYVQAPKFYIDNNNVFAKEADGTSRLTVSDVDEIGAVTKFVRIGGGTISASGDVNVAGNLWVGKTSIFNDGINTDKIDEKTTGAGVTVEGVKFKAGAVSGISDINDGIIKFSKNGTKDIVQINSDLMFNDDAGRQAATLTLEGVKTLNGLSNGSSKIKADDGSVVGGVKFDNKNITDVDSVMVNKDANNQVQINSEGIVVGLHSTVIGSDGVYAGGHTATTAKAVLGADGSIKGAGDGAGKYKFTVDSSNGTVTINDGGNVATISGGGISIADASGSDYLTMGKGTVLASASVISPKFFVDPNNAFEKNSLKVGDGTKGVTIADGEITTTGDTTVGGNLSVAGTSTFTGKTTFSGGINTDTIEEATPNAGVTVDGVLLKDGGVNASAMSITGATGSLNVKDIGGTSTMIYTKAADGTNTIWIDPATGNISTNGTLQVGGGVAGTKPSVTIDGATGSIKVGQNDTEKFAVDGTTGNVKTKGSLEVDSNATVGGNIKGQSLNIGTTGTEFTVDTVGHMTSKSAQIGSVGINNTGVITGVTSLTTDALHVTGAFTTGGNLTVTGDLSASGAIKGKTISITDGGSIAGVSFATGGNLTATTGTIAGVSFAAGGDVSGVHDLTASATIQGATLKVNDKNLLDNNGLNAEKAVIDSVVIDDASITSTGANGLDVENVNLNNGAITANSATIGGVNTLDNTGIYVATGSKIQVGVNTKIEDGSIAVSTNTNLTDQALNLNAANKWTAAGGLVADKATVNGVVLGADATQGKATFTDAAGKVTTIAGDTITTGTITAGELLVDSISLGKDPANKNITIGSNGDIKTNGDITVTGADGDTTVIDGAQATFGNNAMNQTIINKGDIAATAKNAADAQQSTLTHNNKGFKVAGKDASGTKASSFGFDTSTGIGTFTGQDGTTTAINGSNLTLTNGTNSTALTAGGATFTGADGRSDATGVKNKTIIDGGIITTDTLNVQRIELGDKLVDSNGTPLGSNLSMDKQGNFSAAGGNFTVKGGTGTDKGAFTNKVGNTTLQTDTTGASMKYNNGTVESNVSVGDDSAKISAGASSIEVKNDGITNTGVTTFKGAVDSSVPTTETTINGNTIKTGHLITDKLTITGSGAAAGTGSGSIAFGGDGSITSNIKDAATGKEATFKTDETGTFTEAKDIDGNKTTNTVNAKGNTNVVTDGTNTSTATQTATSIGGVVTNGTVTMKQELTADGLKLEQTGYDEVNIAKGDVTVKNNRNTANPNQEVHLSDLGSLNNLDSELTARDKYQDNKTAVGAINAEAGIRREEVARLDNRIDDVNNRVDKVGAMAAAIASLKSIGYDPQAPSEFSIGLGQYKGETGVAMGFFHYPNKNFMINVSLSTAGGETMGGIGATWRFGHKSPQKLLEEQREVQAKKELAAAEKYQAAAKLAKEAQERAEYAAKVARQAQVSADNAKAAADATQAKHFQ